MNKLLAAKKKRVPWTRLRVSHGPEYQFLDPFTGRELHFPNRLHRDNFLVQFGEPDIEEIIPEYPTVSVLFRGEVVVTRFDATIRKRNGTCLLQEVKPNALLHPLRVKESTTRQINAQATFAEQAGAVYEIRTENEIYRYPLLVENKQRMRQILVLHRDENLDSETKLLTSLVSQNPMFRIAELGIDKNLAPMPLQRVEAAAYRMYAEGLLSINLKEARYGTADSVASHVRLQ